MIDDITQRQTRLDVVSRPSINEPNSIYYAAISILEIIALCLD